MKKPIVGILCGGFSSEKEISFKSGINVMKNLSDKFWDSHLIKINNNSLLELVIQPHQKFVNHPLVQMKNQSHHDPYRLNMLWHKH